MCVCVTSIYIHINTDTHGRPQKTRPCRHPLPERLPEGGWRNEDARGRRVAAGGAARVLDELEAREAEAGMRNGRGEADLGTQRRDHE